MNILKLSKSYEFEGKTFTQINFDGIENLCAADMIAVQKILERQGNITILPEMSLEYACYIAARVTKHPVEFFKGLSCQDAIKLKNIVTEFFFGSE